MRLKHSSDKTTTLDVCARRDRIVIREDLPGYPPPNRYLVLIKRKCRMQWPMSPLGPD